MDAIIAQTNLQKLPRSRSRKPGCGIRAIEARQNPNLSPSRPPRLAPHLLAPGLRPGQPLAPPVEGQGGSLGPWLLPGALR